MNGEFVYAVSVLVIVMVLLTFVSVIYLIDFMKRDRLQELKNAILDADTDEEAEKAIRCYHRYNAKAFPDKAVRRPR